MIITPKSARKHQKRQVEQLAVAQLNKIRLHLDGYIREHETPAQAVKRLRDELHDPKTPVELQAPVEVAA
jgi:hypothetical protein